MKEIRGELRAATGTPSDDEDSTFNVGGRKKSTSGFVLGPSNMRDYQAEGEATGLESLFNSAFTIKEDPLTKGKKGNEQKDEREQKGFVIDGDTVRENVMVMRAIKGLCAMLVACIGIAIAMGWIEVKSTIEGFLYEKETFEEVHEVVEDFVQDYIGT